MESEPGKLLFHVGDTLHTVSPDDVTPETTLNEYLREKSNLTGTKKMCLEGGCGCCVVAVEEIDSKKVFAVNSCLVSIFSCHGWKIHTVEGIGDPTTKYHALQELLASKNGSQCGFCSPGMIMNMYALQNGNKKLSEKQIENSFGGNICRCTGYRPILQAFKSLATADNQDIEDLKPCDMTKCHTQCAEKCKNIKPLELAVGKSRWLKVYLLADLIQILRDSEGSYMLVAGNTARGVYKDDPVPNTYIDIAAVKEMSSYSIKGDYLTLGANMTLTNTKDLFYQLAAQNPSFAYLKQAADHIDLVAHVPVRNIGTIAGNLMIKHNHPEFPSDIFLLLETFNATLVIIDTDTNETRISPHDFIKIDMEKRIIKSILINGYDASYKFGSFKIMPRAQNAHAIVNAGFLLKLKDNIVQSARIVYGGINPSFVHAKNTEKYLLNKNIFDNNNLQQAYSTLNGELKPDWVLPDPKPEFRKNLAISLFYKYILSIAPAEKVSAKNKSGSTILQRPVSSGTQEYGSIKEKYPLTQPIIKLEALAQTSGRAVYVPDLPDLPGQLFVQFVQARAVPNSVISNINTTDALKIPGVVGFFGKDDIPGKNTYSPTNAGYVLEEELFCSGTVLYFNQPVGVIVAKTQEIAIKAAKMVKVVCLPAKDKPLLSIQEVLSAPDSVKTSRVNHITDFVAKSKGKDTKKVVKGNYYIGKQYYFHMENQCCQVIPTDDDGIEMLAATQYMEANQIAAAAVLNIPESKISVSVRRLGGGFGGKLFRCLPISTASALVAFKLKKPVKMFMTLESNMEICGSRFPFYVDYEVGVNDKGVIQYLEASLYSDFGVGQNEALITNFMLDLFQNYYNVENWNFSIYSVKTDTHANSSARAPGSLEGSSAIESIMEHIAHSLNLDPLDVKLVNANLTKHVTLNNMLTEMTTWGDIASRKKAIAQFNKDNRWRKKALSIVPLNFTMEVSATYIVLVSIYRLDGSVAIAHAGIEMGQGINTKVAQVAAYTLGISMDLVSIKPSNSTCSPNVSFTGGSLTSEAVCYATAKACKVLLDRMQPIKDKMKNPTWVELVQNSYVNFVQLSASSMYSPLEPNIKEYSVYGVGVSEVEVDILTGQHLLHRVDIMEDVGDSMNPIVDIGQLEGAFMMGLGYFTSEEYVFNEQGQVMTNRTWNYKPPGAKDIPIILRIKFPEKIPNKVGVLNTKAIGEPPLCLSVSVPLAIRSAVGSARTNADSSKPNWYPFDGCSTVENTFMNCLNDYKQYTL